MSLATMQNGGSLPRDAVPLLPLDELRALVIGAPAAHRRVASLFHAPPGELFVVLAEDGDARLHVGRARIAGDAFPSMTPECHQVHMFEREIAEQWGVEPTGHPWLKRVRFHPPYRAGKDVWPGPIAPAVGPFFRVEGEEVHEVAVGPVHAGVIEPGHFRFQCHGEHVFHLEIALGFQHRGVERALIGGPHKRTIFQMEALAGDTPVGHATAYAELVEALAGMRAPSRAMALRGVALELERLANHTGDLGALANDVGFLPTASYCGRLRGDFLNLTAAISGSRFGRGLVRPGGVGFDVDGALVSDMKGRLAKALSHVESAADLLWSTASVQARFEATGKVDHATALDLGLVGVAARASGVGRDVRRDFPTGIFAFNQVPVSTWHTGDVFARAWVRWLEIKHSVGFIQERLNHLPAGVIRKDLPAPRPDRFAVSLVEGWRGEICHAAMTDAAGRFAFYKVVDPSFHNWTGLAMALRGQQISDFPLCNKSFNLSYCGHDL